MQTIKEWVDDKADRFEAEWQKLQPPRIDDYLAGLTGERREALQPELEWIDRAYRTKLGLGIPQSVDDTPTDFARRKATYPQFSDTKCWKSWAGGGWASSTRLAKFDRTALSPSK